jgi:hypothetical protein
MITLISLTALSASAQNATLNDIEAKGGRSGTIPTITVNADVTPLGTLGNLDS